MSQFTEEIKVRVKPMEKLALQQLAKEDERDLSEIVRRALGEFLKARAGKPSQTNVTHAGS